MSRLTIAQRDQIRKKAVADKYYDKIAAAEKLFIEDVEKSVKKLTPAWYTDEVKSSGMVRTTSTIIVNGIQDSYNVERYDKRQRENYEVCFRYPVKHIISIKVTKAIQSKMDKIVKLKDDQKTYGKKLSSALRSFTTHKKLIEMIPEIEPFVKSLGIVVISKSLISVKEITEVRKLIKNK